MSPFSTEPAGRTRTQMPCPVALADQCQPLVLQKMRYKCQLSPQFQGKDTQSIAGSASTASTCAQQDSTISLKEWPTEELKTHDESGMADVGTDTVSVAQQPTRQMSASDTVSSHLPEAPSVDAQDRKQQVGLSGDSDASVDAVDHTLSSYTAGPTDKILLSAATVSSEDQILLGPAALCEGDHVPVQQTTTSPELSMLDQPLTADTKWDSSGKREKVLPAELVTLYAMETEENQQANISDLLGTPAPSSSRYSQQTLANMQAEDPDLQELHVFVKQGHLPQDEIRARKMVLQQSLFTVVDDVLYFVDPKRNNRKRAVVPKSLQRRLLEETHCGPYGAHFSGQRMFNVLVSSWWWGHMFSDATKFAKASPECAVMTGVGRRIKPPLHPIPVQRPFQILGIDIMDLPLTERGNRHVVVVQDLFTKWPFVFPVPDQRATRIARLLAEEVIPWFGVPEALLSDRGANLLSHLVLDLCKI